MCSCPEVILQFSSYFATTWPVGQSNGNSGNSVNAVEVFESINYSYMLGVPPIFLINQITLAELSGEGRCVSDKLSPINRE